MIISVAVEKFIIIFFFFFFVIHISFGQKSVDSHILPVYLESVALKSFCVIHRNCIVILIGKRRGAQSSGKLALKKIIPSGLYFSALILVTFRSVDFFPGFMVFGLPKSL